MSSDSPKASLVNRALIRERLLDQLIRHGYPTLIAIQCVGFLVYLALAPFSDGNCMTMWIVVFTTVNAGRFVSLTLSRRHFCRDNINRIADYQVLGVFQSCRCRHVPGEKDRR